MAYEGKYRNTLPFICAAGVKNKPNFSVKDTLREYKLVDGIDTLKNELHVPKKEEIIVKLPKLSCQNRGIFTEARDVLCSPVKTRYQTLINDLKESVYKSYWNRNLGTTLDAIPAFPEGRNIDEITFGERYKYETTAKDLIHPPKTPYQVLWESQINHEAYKKIYDDYNPSERIDRGYKSPPYNSNQTFGKRCGYDRRGMKTKCCLDFGTSELCIANKTQCDWMERNQRKLGKCLEPHKELLPKNVTFGKAITKDLFSVEDLLRCSPLPRDIKNLRMWLSSFNRLKFQIDDKIDANFDHKVLLGKMKFADVDRTGKIHFNKFLKILHDYDIRFNIPNVKALLQKIDIVVSDRLDYEKFLKSIRGDLELGKMMDIPPEQLDLISTYQEANCGRFLIDRNMNCPRAGLPSHRFDERKPSSAFSDRYVQLSDYTHVEDCIRPSIFTQYSLSHREFFTPRDEDVIRKLFEKIGYKLSDEKFAELWKIGMERDNCDRVCVETFRDLLKEYYPQTQKFVVDEIDC